MKTQQNARVSLVTSQANPTYPTHGRSLPRGVEPPYRTHKLPEVRFRRNIYNQIIPDTYADMETCMIHGVKLSPTEDYREVIGMCRNLVWGVFTFHNH